MWRAPRHGPRDSRAVFPVAMATGRAPAQPVRVCWRFGLSPFPLLRGPRCAARVSFSLMVAAGAGGLDAERIYCWRWFD